MAVFLICLNLVLLLLSSLHILPECPNYCIDVVHCAVRAAEERVGDLEFVPFIAYSCENVLHRIKPNSLQPDCPP
jgi:hypothetical protein